MSRFTVEGLVGEITHQVPEGRASNHGGLHAGSETDRQLTVIRPSKRKGGCKTCHTIGRDGGSLGPDLSDVGRRRDLQYLEESIVRPEADVPQRYRAVRIVTKSGETAAGIKLNEDDLSIQLRDEKDNLRSFWKDNLRLIARDRPSLMPAFGSKLTKKEIDDVVAYLSGLRGMQ